MRKLINLENGEIIGEVPWFEISDAMKKKADLLKSAIIMVNNSLINLLPSESKTMRKLLNEYYKKSKKITSLPVGVSDTIIDTHDFICKGILKDKNGNPLVSYKLWIYDKDLIENDYLGSVITDKNGEFEFSFSYSAFRDFGEKIPDFLIKIFKYDDNEFKLIVNDRKIEDFVENLEKNFNIVDFGEIII